MSSGSSAAVDERWIIKRLQSATNTQESVESLSSWAIAHKTHHEKIVSIWFKVLQTVKVEQRVTLFYLCNEVVQTCKRRHAIVFKDAFKEVLKDATFLVRDISVRRSITRIFNVWKERGVYDAEFVNELLDVLTDDTAEVKPSLLSDLLSTFQLSALTHSIETFLVHEAKTEEKRCDLIELSVSTEEIERQKQLLKDRKQHSDYIDCLIESSGQLSDYITSLRSELKERQTVIKSMEQAEIFYEEQNRDAFVVINAYKAFGKRLDLMRKKLDEHRGVDRAHASESALHQQTFSYDQKMTEEYDRTTEEESGSLDEYNSLSYRIASFARDNNNSFDVTNDAFSDEISWKSRFGSSPPDSGTLSGEAGDAPASDNMGENGGGEATPVLDEDSDSQCAANELGGSGNVGHTALTPQLGNSATGYADPMKFLSMLIHKSNTTANDPLSSILQSIQPTAELLKNQSIGAMTGISGVQSFQPAVAVHPGPTMLVGQSSFSTNAGIFSAPIQAPLDVSSSMQPVQPTIVNHSSVWLTDYGTQSAPPTPQPELLSPGGVLPGSLPPVLSQLLPPAPPPPPSPPLAPPLPTDDYNMVFGDNASRPSTPSDQEYSSLPDTSESALRWSPPAMKDVQHISRLGSGSAFGAGGVGEKINANIGRVCSGLQGRQKDRRSSGGSTVRGESYDPGYHDPPDAFNHPVFYRADDLQALSDEGHRVGEEVWKAAYNSNGIYVDDPALVSSTPYYAVIGDTTYLVQPAPPEPPSPTPTSLQQQLAVNKPQQQEGLQQHQQRLTVPNLMPTQSLLPPSVYQNTAPPSAGLPHQLSNIQHQQPPPSPSQTLIPGNGYVNAPFPAGPPPRPSQYPPDSLHQPAYTPSQPPPQSYCPVSSLASASFTQPPPSLSTFSHAQSNISVASLPQNLCQVPPRFNLSESVFNRPPPPIGGAMLQPLGAATLPAQNAGVVMPPLGPPGTSNITSYDASNTRGPPSDGFNPAQSLVPNMPVMSAPTNPMQAHQFDSSSIHTIPSNTRMLVTPNQILTMPPPTPPRPPSFLERPLLPSIPAQQTTNYTLPPSLGAPLSGADNPYGIHLLPPPQSLPPQTLPLSQTHNFNVPYQTPHASVMQLHNNVSSNNMPAEHSFPSGASLSNQRMSSVKAWLDHRSPQQMSQPMTSLFNIPEQVSCVLSSSSPAPFDKFDRIISTKISMPTPPVLSSIGRFDGGDMKLSSHTGTRQHGNTPHQGQTSTCLSNLTAVRTVDDKLLATEHSTNPLLRPLGLNETDRVRDATSPAVSSQSNENIHVQVSSLDKRNSVEDRNWSIGARRNSGNVERRSSSDTRLVKVVRGGFGEMRENSCSDDADRLISDVHRTVSLQAINASNDQISPDENDESGRGMGKVSGEEWEDEGDVGGNEGWGEEGEGNDSMAGDDDEFVGSGVVYSQPISMSGVSSTTNSYIRGLGLEREHRDNQREGDKEMRDGVGGNLRTHSRMSSELFSRDNRQFSGVARFGLQRPMRAPEHILQMRFPGVRPLLRSSTFTQRRGGGASSSRGGRFRNMRPYHF